MNESAGKLIVSTHYLVYGTPQALRDYLLQKKVKKLLYISHPLFFDNDASYIETIVRGKVVEKKLTEKRLHPSFLNYLYHMYLTIKWIVGQPDFIELYIGVDPLNAFAGIILRKMKKVRRVIYYTIDYVPKRFTNPLLDRIYFWLDAFCLKNADETWNVSPKIAEARELFKGLYRKTYTNQKVVPIGIWFSRVKRLPFNKIHQHKLFFIGHLMESAGVQLVLESIPLILKKIPDFHFLVVGGGEYEEPLKRQAKKLGIEEYVEFTGWIKNRDTLDKIMSDSALAIAPYNSEKSTTTHFSDPTKLKDYLSAGLPIILTDVPHNAHDLSNNKCAIVVEYDKKQIADAVCKLMTDSNVLKKYRENAIRYIKNYDWNVIFDTHLLPLLFYEKHT